MRARVGASSRVELQVNTAGGGVVVGVTRVVIVGGEVDVVVGPDVVEEAVGAAVEVVVVMVGNVVLGAARGSDAPHAVRTTASALAANPLRVMSTPVWRYRVDRHTQ